MNDASQTVKLFSSYILKKGDNDKKKVWGNKRRKDKAEYVHELQRTLKKIGVYLNKIDGDFGQLTHDAVERFQWNAKFNDYRLKNNLLVSITELFKDKIDGKVGTNTKNELLSWKNANYVATGSLVRVSLKNLGNTELNDGFTKLIHPSLSDNEILIDSDMVSYLKIMNSEAKSLKIDIALNQALRIKGNIVSGAAYKPASKSQHLIGHAVDCNIIDGDSSNISSDFKNGKETEKAKKFIKNVKAKGLRWGGDFPPDSKGRKDTPHFDKRVVPSSLEYDCKYFFNQRSYTDKQPIRKITIS